MEIIGDFVLESRGGIDLPFDQLFLESVAGDLAQSLCKKKKLEKDCEEERGDLGEIKGGGGGDLARRGRGAGHASSRGWKRERENVSATVFDCFFASFITREMT